MQSNTIVKYEIPYSGVVVSLNQYKSLHWRKLKLLIDGFKMQIKAPLRKANVKPLAWMELTVYHNTRYDMDNVVGVVKPFVDMLRKQGILDDDTRRYWDNLRITYSPDIKKNTLIFEITGELKPQN
jgi:Holliday junction resolvase RusA-like endonuclease